MRDINSLIASKIGLSKTMFATLMAFLLLEIIFFIIDTRDDFANGIMLFIEAQLTFQFGFILVTVFGLTAILGRIAGREIMIKKKNFMLVSMKYSCIIIFILLVYLIISLVVSDLVLTPESLLVIILQVFQETIFSIIVPLIIVWLVAGWQIKLLADKMSLS